MALPEEDRYVAPPTKPVVPTKPPPVIVPPVVNKPVIPPPALPPVTLPVTGGTTNPAIAADAARWSGQAARYTPPVTPTSSARANAASTARYNAQAAMWNKFLQSTTTKPVRATTYNSVPAGIDREWWEQFKAEHDGVDPETYYKGDLDAALRDRAWGDQFYRTYNRPPSIYDWKASYYDRKYPGSGYGGGGGGAGGGTAGGAPVPGMSPLWDVIFSNYYATRPGQSPTDYANFLGQLAKQVGRDLTPDEATRMLAEYQMALLNRPGTAGSYEDLMTYLNRYMQQPGALPPVAYLTMGEI